MKDLNDKAPRFMQQFGMIRWFAHQGLAVKITFLAVLTLLPVMLVALTIYFFALTTEFEQVEGLWLQGLSYHLTERMDKTLYERTGDVLAFSASPQAQTMQIAALQDWLPTLIESYSPNYSLMLIANTKGQILAASAQDISGEPLSALSLIGQNVASKEWFQNALKKGSGEIDITQPQIDDLNKTLEPGDHLNMGFSAPIRNANNQVVGVWSNRLKWAQIQDHVTAVVERAANENSDVSFVVLDKNGLILEHPDQKEILKNRIENQAGSKNPATEGYILGRDYSSKTGRGVEAFYRNKNGQSGKLGWLVLASEPLFDVYSDRDATMQRTLLFCLALLSIVVLALVFATRYVSKGLKNLGQNALGLAAGDLEQRLGTYPQDELGRFAGAFEQMMTYQKRIASAANAIKNGDLTQVVPVLGEKDILGAAFSEMNNKLRELLQTLQHGTVSMSSASQQMLRSSQAQAGSVQQQFAAIAQTSATVEEVQTTTEQALEYAVQTREAAQGIARVVTLGVQATEAAQGSMSDIKFRVGDIAENILALSEQTQAIGEIIATVAKIADQSNLLALNAAIEAARAGEHGKGFGVVALEIRMLSEQSKTATLQVRDLLSEIQRATNNAVMTTEQGIKVADVGVDSIARVSEVISQLNLAIENAAQNAYLISASVQQHSVGMNQIASAMQSLQSNAETTLETSSQSKNAAEDLSELAMRLKTLTESYKMQT